MRLDVATLLTMMCVTVNAQYRVTGDQNSSRALNAWELSPDGNTSTLTSSASSRDNLTLLPPRDETLAAVEITVQGIILFLTLAGNGVVLVILLSMSHVKDLGRMYTMIGHLSCADLSVAVFNLFPQLMWDVTHRFYGGRVLCKVVKYLQVTTMYASSYVLISTAIDRYMAICHPMRSHSWTSATAHRLAAAAWIASLLFSLPQLVIFDYVEVRPNSGVYDCWENFSPNWTLQLYITWFTVAVYFVPLVILAGIYTRICAVVWHSTNIKRAPPVVVVLNIRPPSIIIARSRLMADAPPRLLASNRDGSSRPREGEVSSLTAADDDGGGQHRDVGQTPESAGLAQQQILSRAKTKTVKLTLTVIICYTICWAPFFVSHMWSAWDPNAPFEGTTMVITLLLASLNSCTNPWIYLVFSDRLRSKIVRCCSPSWRQANAVSSDLSENRPAGPRR